MTDNLISIIVPVYKVEKYIEKCLLSILKQDYSNIEIICIDDASPDNSCAVCEKYAKEDTRIRIIKRKVNSGLASVRNMGMDEAKGEFIMFVDSDDWVEKDYVSTLYELAVEYNADIAQCSYARTAIEQVKIGQTDDNEIEIISGNEALKRMYRTEIYQPEVGYTVVWDKIYKKSVLKEVKFIEGKLFEDQYFSALCFYKSKRVAVTNKKLYCYRKNLSGITMQKYHIKFQDEIEMHELQAEYFYRHKETDIRDMVIARCMPLAINHYVQAEYFEDKEAMKKAYKHIQHNIWKYIFNKKIPIMYKIKAILFLISPVYFLGYKFDIKYSEA